MKTNRLKNVFTFLLLSLAIFSFGQDKIIKKNGEKLKVIVKEVGDKEIKYVMYDDPNGVLFTIPKALVRNVEFSYGQKMKMENTAASEDYYLDDKINNFTLNFSALGGNTLALGYERAIKPGQSVFTELKFYGAGIKTLDEKSRSGFGIDLAYRLKLKELFDGDSYRPRHILHGSYFSPVIGYSGGKYVGANWDGTTSYTNKHSIAHFGLQAGKQWIIQNTISLDLSAGFHYYTGSFTRDGNSDNYIGFIRAGNMSGADNKLFSFNIRVGFLTGKKKKK